MELRWVSVHLSIILLDKSLANYGWSCGVEGGGGVGGGRREGGEGGGRGEWREVEGREGGREGEGREEGREERGRGGKEGEGGVEGGGRGERERTSNEPNPNILVSILSHFQGQTNSN